MPYVSVHVDADEVLPDLSEQELRDELRSREIKKGGSPFNADYRIPLAAARTALEKAADALRRIGRVDLAYKLDEINVDNLGR